MFSLNQKRINRTDILSTLNHRQVTKLSLYHFCIHKSVLDLLSLIYMVIGAFELYAIFCNFLYIFVIGERSEWRVIGVLTEYCDIHCSVLTCQSGG